MSNENYESLIITLQERFEKNMERHEGMDWNEIQERMKANPKKITTLSEMERTGGEPDVIGRDEATGAFVFCDCSPESPAGRRSLCYDQDAFDSRKENKPRGSVLGMAASMGIDVLGEQGYRALQALGEFDMKTSSWVKTPDSIRALGGALFGDRRYDHVFVYHNGADSYYAARGFRGLVRI